MKYACIALILILQGCATMQKPETFAVCKAADVVTTGYALNTGRFVEKNPFVAPLVSHGILPLAVISFGLWWLIDHYNEPTATLSVNTVTCPVAAHNLWLLTK